MEQLEKGSALRPDRSLERSIDARSWRRVCRLFERAVALAPELREDFLAAGCGDDPDVERTVRRMLAVDPTMNALDRLWRSFIPWSTGDQTGGRPPEEGP